MRLEGKDRARHGRGVGNRRRHGAPPGRRGRAGGDRRRQRAGRAGARGRARRIRLRARRHRHRVCGRRGRCVGRGARRDRRARQQRRDRHVLVLHQHRRGAVGFRARRQSPWRDRRDPCGAAVDAAAAHGLDRERRKRGGQRRVAGLGDLFGRKGRSDRLHQGDRARGGPLSRCAATRSRRGRSRRRCSTPRPRCSARSASG